MLPNAPLPEPYACCDIGSFAERTLLVRLPEIARRVIQENDFPDWIDQRVRALIDEMPDTPIREIQDQDAPDLNRWVINLRPWLGKPWRQLSFLACEMYFYRRILEATRYFQAGYSYLRDPYARQKALGYTSSRTIAADLAERLEGWRDDALPLERALCEAIEANLWGNRADLSLWPVGEDGAAHPDLHQAEAFLLANDLQAVVSHIAGMAGQPQAVHFLIDNSGLELIYDLALADLLLSRNAASQVILHVKAHPTFVSDAILSDVVETCVRLSREPDRRLSAFGERLVERMAEKRLAAAEHFFWNAPLAFWQMPARLTRTFSGAGLVISKGDANYRRLMGDLRWREDTPFHQVVGYFPAPLLALRASKSEVMVGLRAGQAVEMDRIEADWRTNGRWGLIQFRS